MDNFTRLIGGWKPFAGVCLLSGRNTIVTIFVMISVNRPIMYGLAGSKKPKVVWVNFLYVCDNIVDEYRCLVIKLIALFIKYITAAATVVNFTYEGVNRVDNTCFTEPRIFYGLFPLSLPLLVLKVFVLQAY